MDAVIFEKTPEAGISIFNGKEFMQNSKGDWTPIAKVRPEAKLEDQTVRKCIEYAESLSAQVSRFKGHTAADLTALDNILAEKYDAKIGGKKGNRTYQSYDGLMRVQVQVADLIDFGPELQIAKSLINECLTEWSADSREEIQAIVMRAFNTDKEGQVSRADVFMLLRLEITDARWQRAMEAIRNAIRVTGSKEYVRFYKRNSIEDGWDTITIDMAKA